MNVGGAFRSFGGGYDKGLEGIGDPLDFLDFYCF